MSWDVSGNLPALELFAYSGGAALRSNLPTLSLSATMESRSISSRDPLKLPVIRLDAKMGDRLSLEASLPTLSLSAQTGMSLEGVLPSLELAAFCSAVQSADLTGKLPTLSLSSRMGARASSLKLPTLSVDMSLSTSIICTLNRTLPGLTLSATMSGGSTENTLEAKLPALKLSAHCYPDIGAVLNGYLPALKLSAELSKQGRFELEAKLPTLGLTANLYAPYMSLDATLPALVFVSATGDEYGGAGGPVLVEEGRLDDYVMRYSRW